MLKFAGMLAVLAFSFTARADSQGVLERARKQVEAADYRASGKLVCIDASQHRTSYPIKISAHWFPGVLRVIFELDPPSEASVNPRRGEPLRIFLEMRPSGQSAIRTAHPGSSSLSVLPFEKWGENLSDGAFSYEDLLESQYYWQNQTVLKSAKFGARDCDVLRSTPGASDRTHYAKVDTWLDRTISYPVYAEKTLKDNRTVKEFIYLGLRQTSGVWAASQVEAKVRGHDGSTLLIIDRGSAKAHLTLKDFTPEQIFHFEGRP